jgi:hypothetical protein
MSTQFLLESLKGRDHLEDLGVDGSIVIDLREIGLKEMDWTHLTQEWRALVNTVINFRVS